MLALALRKERPTRGTSEPGSNLSSFLSAVLGGRAPKQHQWLLDNSPEYQTIWRDYMAQRQAKQGVDQFTPAQKAEMVRVALLTARPKQGELNEHGVDLGTFLSSVLAGQCVPEREWLLRACPEFARLWTANDKAREAKVRKPKFTPDSKTELLRLALLKAPKSTNEIAESCIDQPFLKRLLQGKHATQRAWLLQNSPQFKSLWEDKRASES